eukprot:scaffold58792_cov16-Tisochrysis_lutea.AAC.1
MRRGDRVFCSPKNMHMDDSSYELVSCCTHPQDIMSTYLFSGNAEMRYAQNIELENGRWAMIGFLVAVLVEAATGQGIIGQLFGYAKWSGLLGKDS